MSEDHDNRKHPGAGFWATIILAAVVAYPLSIGPVAWLYHKTGEPGWLGTAGDIVYAPLAFTIDKCPTKLGSQFHGYIEWWTELANP